MNELGLNPNNPTTKAPLEGDNYEIDETFIKIDFSHNGKKFKVIIDQFMYLGRDEGGEITLESVRQQLESIDRFKSYFLIAVNELVEYRKTLQSQYDKLYASFSEEMEKDIITERMRLKEEKKVPASMFQGITKESIKNKILLHPIYGAKCDNADRKIAETQKNENLIEGLRKDLYERSSNLRKLLESLEWDRRLAYNQRIIEE